MSALTLLLLLVTVTTAVPDTEFLFASRLVAALGEEKFDKCIAYSPIAVKVSLALLYLGAANDTEIELKNALRLHSSREEVAKTFGEIVNDVNENTAFSLSVTLFIKTSKELKISKKFQRLAYVFQAELENLTPGKEYANRRRLNEWIDQQTHHRIPKFIPDETNGWVVDTSLVTESYFKAKWLTPFPKNRTYIDSNGHMGQKFKMMVQDSVMPFAVLKEFDAYTVLLKFKDTDIAMLAMMPKEENDLENLEKMLAEVDLRKVPDSLHEAKVTLKLPKVKVETDITLKPVMRKLDMINVFFSGNFSGILTTSSTLAFTEVRHKTIIEISEEGIEVASVMGVEVYNPGDTHGDNFNHNFFFALIDKNFVYFAGHVVNG